MKKLKEVMDYKKIDNIEIDGIDTKDYPDFCDAYISSADYDGVPMTDKQLDEINDAKELLNEIIRDKSYFMIYAKDLLDILSPK